MIASVGPAAPRTRRALVPLPSAAGTAQQRVEPAAPLQAPRLERRADFLAQLIAARDGMAQLRARRRADPAEAVRAYETAARLGEAVAPVERARA
ncbi:hypothetical protein [Labrys wisconsinensis]|uniref:Uncharacterized protein n=1 Tax=Labrys wisconsinensis TaxID=425677 RepID=A0ABU0JLF2_9HYPH|nr:hypothetical protein [Labrys wisconsinensis]MDQ0475113.1 hypothetical protein [Labrys wisconsinensis]